MIFERTRDYALIKQIVTHPQIWPHVSDDFSPSPEDWQPFENDSIWYVLAKDGAELLGVWVFSPDNAVCWKVHTCLLPNAYGKKAKHAAREMAQWIWANTACLRIVTDVPRYNRVASIFARWAGMSEFGVNPAAYMKNGKLQDVILLGMSKPGGVICRSQR